MQSAFLQILLAPLLFRKYSHKIITLIYIPNVLIQTSPDFTIAFSILTFSNRQSFLRLHFTPHPATYFAMQRYGTFCSIPYWLSRDFHAFGLKTARQSVSVSSDFPRTSFTRTCYFSFSNVGKRRIM